MSIKTIYFSLLAASLLAPSADAITIDFDTDAVGSPIVSEAIIDSQYAAFGVSFSALEDGLPADVYTKISLDGDPTPSSPNIWTNCGPSTTTSCGGFRADVLRIEFASPVEDVSWLANSLGSQGATFEAYDASGTLLESVLAANTNLFDPFSFTATGIRRIDIVQPNDSWGHAIDDLSFTIVPEPCSLLTAALGMSSIGMIVARQRRQR